MLAGCGSKKTIIEGSSGADLPNQGFPISGDKEFQRQYLRNLAKEQSLAGYHAQRLLEALPNGVCPGSLAGSELFGNHTDPGVILAMIRDCTSGNGSGRP